MRMTRRKFTDEEYLELYRKGLPDNQIAKILAVDVRACWERRHKLGLPVNPRPSRRRFTDDQLRKLHSRGLTDLEMATKLGVSYDTVVRYRTLLGLPPNKKLKWNYEKVVTLYQQGFGVREVAKRTGIPESTITYFLRKKKILRPRKDTLGRRVLFRDNIVIPQEKWKCAYLAALIDGEGSILLKKHGKTKKMIPTVKFVNTDKKLVDWTLRNFGGYPRKEVRTKHGWKTLYRWQTSSITGCFKILTAILPFLITKRENALEVLDLCATKLKEKGFFSKNQNHKSRGEARE